MYSYNPDARAFVLNFLVAYFFFNNVKFGRFVFRRLMVLGRPCFSMSNSMQMRWGKEVLPLCPSAVLPMVGCSIETRNCLMLLFKCFSV